MRYVVDTNIFNRLADGRISRDHLPKDAEFVATHVQLDEIHRTPDGARRELLLSTFSLHQPKSDPTERFVLNVLRLDNAKLSDRSRHIVLPFAIYAWNKSRRDNVEKA